MHKFIKIELKNI